MTTIRYKSPDYYLVDELLTDEHKLIRGAIRDWVNREVIPIIEEANQKHEFPRHLVKELGEIGAFGPFIPVEYGASYSSRVVAQGNLNRKLAEVFGTKGFSLLEIWGLCPSYAYKKIKDINNLPCNERTLENPRDQYHLHIKNSSSLFEDLTQIENRF